MNQRRLKIEPTGDFWKRDIKPLIRLKGRWLERAGFPPGHHVQIIFAAPGEMVMRITEHTDASARLTG